MLAWRVPPVAIPWYGTDTTGDRPADTLGMRSVSVVWAPDAPTDLAPNLESAPLGRIPAARVQRLIATRSVTALGSVVSGRPDE